MFNVKVYVVFSGSSCTQDKENVTKCIITGLKPYTEYTCCITAIFLNQPYTIANLFQKTNATSKFFKVMSFNIFVHLFCIALSVMC